MSKENAIRFLMLKDKDESLRNAFDAIMGKYEDKIISKGDQDKVLQEEIIPLAGEYGYDFTLENFQEMQADGKLSDEELDQIIGGKGQFTQYSLGYCHGHISTYTCDYAPDDHTLETYYNQLTVDCPYYVHLENVLNRRMCVCCANLNVTSELC